MIEFWDQTLRDGEQSPGVFFTPKEKLRLAIEMEEIGIKRAEVGFPIVSKNEFNAVKMILDQGLKMKVVCPARCRQEDIDAVADTGAPEVAVFIGTSPELMKYSLRMNSGEALEKIADSVEYARKRGLFVHAVSEDSTRSDPDFVLRFFKTAVEAGAKGIVVCDTLGVSTPEKTKQLAQIVRRSIRIESYSVHCHDDLGLATANTLAAVEAGFNGPQTTLCGIGERSGNASFEEVCMALEILYGVKTGIRTKMIFRLAELVEKYSGVPIPVHKPVIGSDSFVHEAGVHVAAVLRNPVTYEPFPPEKVGRRRRFNIGKHSGASLLKWELRRLGFQATDVDTRQLSARLKALKEGKSKKPIRQLIDVKRKLDEKRLGISEGDLRLILGANNPKK